MKYKKNNEMEYLDIDEDNIAVYDPESGDTHFIEGTGKIILSMLEDETEESELVSKLCELYSETADVIVDDLKDFLSELIRKKVVISL